MDRIPSTLLAEMVEKIISRYPRANHACYTWEKSAEIIWNDAETVSQLNDAAEIIKLANIWNKQEN